jgi:hypothetical protein
VRSEARRFNVINCGRRWGKTVLGLDLAIEVALDGCQPVGWFAPEYRLLTEAWRELESLLADVASFRKSERRCDLITGGSIECWSFDRTPNAGRSRRYQRVIVDEAAHTDSLETLWTKGLRPTLTDFKGDAWFLSSPNGENYFHNLHGRASDEWKSWTFPSVTNPHLDPAEVESAREDLPDAIYRQEYLAEFLAESVQQLVESAWLDACFTDARPSRRGVPAISLDLAKGTGRDRTVAWVADEGGVLDLVVSAHVGIAEAARLAAALSAQWGVPHDRIIYDAGGWAGPDMARYLEALGIVSALAYHGGVPAGMRFKNRRTRGAWALRQRLDFSRPVMLAPPRVNPVGWLPEIASRPTAQPPTHKIQPVWVMPAPVVAAHWQEIRREVLALRYRYVGHRYELEPKDDLVQRLGHSPDLADGLIMLASLMWGVE